MVEFIVWYLIAMLVVTCIIVVSTLVEAFDEKVMNNYDHPIIDKIGLYSCCFGCFMLALAALGAVVSFVLCIWLLIYAIMSHMF